MQENIGVLCGGELEAGQQQLMLDAEAIRKALRRIAHEIIERRKSLDGLVLAGIPTRGVEVARRLAACIQEAEGAVVETGVIDISMHRDDLATRPKMTVLEETRLPVVLDGKTLVIVDDVFFTGRSVRAAMDAVSSYGRPERIELAVLVDRGNRQLPIRPDFVGKKCTTAFGDRVRVRFENLDGVPDSVQLVKG